MAMNILGNAGAYNANSIKPTPQFAGNDAQRIASATKNNPFALNGKEQAPQFMAGLNQRPRDLGQNIMFNA